MHTVLLNTRKQKHKNKLPRKTKHHKTKCHKQNPSIWIVPWRLQRCSEPPEAIFRAIFHLSFRNICRINFKMKIEKGSLTTFKCTFPTNQSSSNRRATLIPLCFPMLYSLQAGICNREAEVGNSCWRSHTRLWESLIVPSSNAHSWATLIICSMCLNNSLAFFTWQAGSHCPMGRGSSQSLLTAVDRPGRGGAALPSTFDLVPPDYPAAVSKPWPRDISTKHK